MKVVDQDVADAVDSLHLATGAIDGPRLVSDVESLAHVLEPHEEQVLADGYLNVVGKPCSGHDVHTSDVRFAQCRLQRGLSERSLVASTADNAEQRQRCRKRSESASYRRR